MIKDGFLSINLSSSLLFFTTAHSKTKQKPKQSQQHKQNLTTVHVSLEAKLRRPQDLALRGGAIGSWWLLREGESLYFGDLTAGRLLISQSMVTQPCACGQHLLGLLMTNNKKGDMQL